MKRYVIADNYLCFCALIEMILDDSYGIKVSQYELAEVFGVTFPTGTKTIIKNAKYSDKDNELGLHICLEEINHYFEINNIRLKLSYRHINQFDTDEIDEFNKISFRKNKYIIYAFCYGKLFNKIDLYDIGHSVLLEEVLSDRIIKIYDPGPVGYGSKDVSRYEMYDAMRSGSNRLFGIYVFEML